MKRALLIFAGFLITVGFAMYILGVEPFGRDDTVGQQDDNKSNALAALAERQTQASTDAASPKALADMSANTIQEPPPAGRSEKDAPEWKLVWADEFEKQNLDMECWTEVDRKNSYNNELQYYLPKNSYIQNGCLYLTAIKEDRDGKEYTSAMVETGYKLSFRYGRIEASIKLPKGKGVFPAFWLLTNDGGHEIDVMEMIGSEPNTIYGTNHYESNGSKKTSGHITNDTPDEFHAYAVEWEKDSIRWYMDGKLYHTSKKGVPVEDMSIVLNLAVGGNWPGDPDEAVQFPCSMAVEYVRIYARG
jgi:beta-glucanase (GH16 family)